MLCCATPKKYLFVETSGNDELQVWASLFWCVLLERSTVCHEQQWEQNAGFVAKQTNFNSLSVSSDKAPPWDALHHSHSEHHIAEAILKKAAQHEADAFEVGKLMIDHKTKTRRRKSEQFDHIEHFVFLRNSSSWSWQAFWTKWLWSSLNRDFFHPAQHFTSKQNFSHLRWINFTWCHPQP